MSSSITTDPADASQPLTPLKLKSSCDMCSTSKVRCESQKPTCSRCLKLGYPCFYSAARRVGRRHGSRRAAPGLPPAPRQISRTLIERQIHPSHEAPLELVGLSPQTRMLSSRAATGVVPAGNAQSGFLSRPQTNSAPHQVDTASESSQEANKGFSPMSTGTRHHQSPHYQLGAAGAFGSINSSCAPEDMGNGSTSTDCAMATMNLQEQLDVIHSGLCLTASQPQDVFMASVDAAMDCISSALNRLSTVLICPCSERLDVGLLVGAVCMSIMDVYGVIVKLSSSSPPSVSWSPHEPGQSSTAPSRNASMFEDDSSQNWDLSSVSSRSHEGSRRMTSLMKLDQDEHKKDSMALTCIVEGLPKLAGVTLQFTRRSRSTNGCESATAASEVSYALASYARTRLQTLNNEVTAHFMQTT